MICEDQRETIAFLGSPDAHGGRREVERIDTHASVIFLAGDRAYKLKRAVRYDYLDYSTSAKRRSACEAELALGRRTAPEIYRRVVAVVRTRDGRLALADTGDALDWLVEMERFDRELLFDRLAERGVLDAASMQRLGSEIATFHESAERRADRGGYAGMRWVVAGNEAGLVEFGAGVYDAAASRTLAASLRALLEGARGLLEERRRTGFVRRCHGDLHLGNIVLWRGVPTLFDAVEFSDDVACIDVLYDLAFLLMDLEHRGLRPLANSVFNRYLALTGDLDGLALLPLFLSARAAVRAKTSATAAALQAAAAPASALRAAGRAYLDLARDLLAESPPRIVAIGGYSGSGKSTIAAGLAPSFGRAPGALLLRSDVLRKTLLGVEPEVGLGAEAYAPEVDARVYRELCDRAVRAARAGQAVIVDAVFADPGARAALVAAARKAGIPFTGLWLEAPREVLDRRIRNRRGDASDATAEVLAGQLAADPGPLEWTRIDATPPADRVTADAARIALGAAGSRAPAER